MVEFNFQYPLSLSDAALKYLSGNSPKIRWRARGIDGYYRDESPNIKKFLSEEEQATESFSKSIGSQNFDEVTNQFVNRAFQIMSARTQLKLIPEEKRYIFLIGAPRAGGTFLLTDLYRSIGVDFRNLLMEMILDSSPMPQTLLEATLAPVRDVQAFFEMTQFLVWAEKELKFNQTIFKKHSYLIFWFDRLELMFGRKAQYLFHIRHPAANFLSYAQFSLGNGYLKYLKSNMVDQSNIDGLLEYFFRTRGEKFRSLGENEYYKKYLSFWTYYHCLMADCCSKAGNRACVVSYGDEFLQGRAKLSIPLDVTSADEDSLLKSQNEKRLIRKRLDVFQTLSELGVNLEDFHIAVERVQKYWKNLGLKFPVLEIG